MFDFEKGNIKFLRGGKYPHCHGLFIDDQIRAVIDPASDKNKLKAIQQERPVDIIINSHAHEDHILFNYLFPNAALWAHPLEAAAFNDIDYFIEQFYLPGDLDSKTVDEWHHFLTDVVRFQPLKPDRLLIDDEILVFGETRMQVIHTPGHTPGHLAFYFPEEKIFFLADLDLVKFGPLYSDRGSDIDAIIRSLERLSAIEAEVYLTAHGREGIFDGDPEHFQRYVHVIDQREAKLLEFLASGPHTLKAIVKHGIIYGGRTIAGGPWDLNNAEKVMMVKHLERLETRGSVKQEDGVYHLV